MLIVNPNFGLAQSNLAEFLRDLTWFDIMRDSGEQHRIWSFLSNLKYLPYLPAQCDCPVGLSHSFASCSVVVYAYEGFKTNYIPNHELKNWFLRRIRVAHVLAVGDNLYQSDSVVFPIRGKESIYRLPQERPDRLSRLQLYRCKLKLRRRNLTLIWSIYQERSSRIQGLLRLQGCS